MRRRSLTLTLLNLMLESVASAATDFTLDDQFRKAHTRADIFAGTRANTVKCSPITNITCFQVVPLPAFP